MAAKKLTLEYATPRSMKQDRRLLERIVFVLSAGTAGAMGGVISAAVVCYIFAALHPGPLFEYAWQDSNLALAVIVVAGAIGLLSGVIYAARAGSHRDEAEAGSARDASQDVPEACPRDSARQVRTSPADGGHRCLLCRSATPCRQADETSSSPVPTPGRTGYCARLRFALLWAVIFICFGVGFFVGFELSGRAYLLIVYGWADVHRNGLHIVYDRPTLRVSNGDRASELATFAYGLFGIVLDVTFGCLSLLVVSRVTWLLGKRVRVFSAATAASQSYRSEPSGLARERAETLIAFVIMALVVVLIFLIAGHSLSEALRNHAIFLAAASLVIRLTCAGAPEGLELSSPCAGKAERDAKHSDA